MKEEDRQQFAELIVEALGFYRQDATEFQLQIWWEAMRRYEFQDVRKAMSYHIQNPDRGQFPPRPADIVRFLSGGSTDRALRAWSAVERAIRSVGPYQSVVFDDLITHRVLDDMGGWIKLCEIGTEKEMEFQGNEFRTRYQGYAIRRPEDWPPQLTGYVEQDAIARGYQPPDPVVIGDHQRALSVHEHGQTRSKAPMGLSAVKGKMGMLEEKKAAVAGEEPQRQSEG